MRVRLLDITDKGGRASSQEWTQADLDCPKPQKIAEKFFLETQIRPDGSATLIYGGKHSSPEFPWHQPSDATAGTRTGASGFSEYSDEDVGMSLRLWMLETFECAFPITKQLVEDTLTVLAAVCLRHARDRERAKERAGAGA